MTYAGERIQKISAPDTKSVIAYSNSTKNIHEILRTVDACSIEEGPDFCAIQPYKKKIELLSKGREGAIAAKETFLQYVEELKRMNTVWLTNELGDKETLYDLLFFDRRRTVKLIGNEDLQCYFKINKSDFENSFPETGMFLNAKL